MRAATAASSISRHVAARGPASARVTCVVDQAVQPRVPGAHVLRQRAHLQRARIPSAAQSSLLDEPPPVD
eukprot:scaffold1769_cov277-Prasinococcus_capsulatus_cf.AAC.6